jgi:hypothetical protein
VRAYVLLRPLIIQGNSWIREEEREFEGLYRKKTSLRKDLGEKIQVLIYRKRRRVSE